MLRIRLSRVGKRKQPAYRIIVTDSRNPRDGAHVEIIGHYNPLTNPATLTMKEERAIHWLQVGAKPSETAAKLLTRTGVMEKAGRPGVVYKGPDVPAGKRGKKGAAEEAAPAAPAAAAPAAAAPAATAVAEPPAAEAPAAEPEATAAEETSVAEPEAAPAEETAAEEATPAEEPASE